MAWRKLRRSDAEERWFFNSSNCNWVSPNHELFNIPSTWESIVNDCKRAITCTGLDIGAVDVRVAADGKYIVLEVNSAPALGEQGIEIYRVMINKLLK
jgi:glutathione synthase/RimK-type ligase-like ATP-grasp enzyme